MFYLEKKIGRLLSKRFTLKKKKNGKELLPHPVYKQELVLPTFFLFVFISLQISRLCANRLS